MLPFPRPGRCLAFVSRCLPALMVAKLLLGCGWYVSGQDETAPQTTIAEDLFQFAPETPDRILEAAIITRNLDRQEDARKFVRKLLDLQLSDTELRALRQRVGAGPFIELSGDGKMLPEARELLLAINAASRPQPLSEAKLQELIQVLTPSGEAATQAAVELVANGGDSVAALLAVDPGTPVGKVADQLLQNHAREFRYGLMAALPLADMSSRLRILKLLASTADPNIAPRLLRWQFDPESNTDVQELAARAVERLSQGNVSVTTSTDASDLLTQRGTTLLKTAFERFPSIRESEIVTELTSRDVRGELLNDAAAHLTDAAALDARNSRASRLLLVAKSTAAEPALSVAASVAAGQTVPDLAAALESALEIGATNAGIELLRALRAIDFSQIAPETLSLAGRVLRSAVNSPDPRIRFLACDTALNAAHTEISSSAVQRTLKSIRDGSLNPEAVVVHSNDRSLKNLEAALEDAGFAVVPCQTGPDGFDAAAHQMNCELMLIDAESAGWPLATTLANLRSDVRTRNVPIVVTGSARFSDRVSRLGDIHPGIWFLTEPVGIETLMPKLNALQLPPHLLSPDDRAVMKTHPGVSDK